jgi:hypothetical protein
VDKEIENAVFYRCKSKVFTIQSPDPDNTIIDGCVFTVALNGSPNNGMIRNTIIPTIALGPTGYGVNGSLILDGTKIMNFNQNGTRRTLLSDVTLTSGTLAISKASPVKYNFLAAMVPNAQYYYGATDCTNNAVPATSFTVTAVREDASNYYADTNIVGTPSPICNVIACTAVCPWSYQSITQLNTPAGGLCMTSYGVTGKGC